MEKKANETTGGIKSGSSKSAAEQAKVSTTAILGAFESRLLTRGPSRFADPQLEIAENTRRTAIAVEESLKYQQKPAPADPMPARLPNNIPQIFPVVPP
jgi:hypothetical protein